MRVWDMEIGETIPEDHEDHDKTEPQELVEKFLEKESHKRKPTWEWEIIWEAKRYGTPKGVHRERRKENSYYIYMVLLFDIIDIEPSTYEEVAEKK